MKIRTLKDKYNLSVSEWEHLIDERILSERDRYIMKRRLLDNASYDTISEEVGLSIRYTKSITSRCMTILKSYIEKH